MKETKAFTDRHRSPLSYWGRPWGPRSCFHQRRGCWGKTCSPVHSRALGCLGPPPPPARCSEWWRGLKVSKTGGGQKCKRLDIFQNLLLGLRQHSLFLDKPVKSTGCPYNTKGWKRSKTLWVHGFMQIQPCSNVYEKKLAQNHLKSKASLIKKPIKNS